jgi:hypothetical protein
MTLNIGTHTHTARRCRLFAVIIYYLECFWLDQQRGQLKVVADAGADRVDRAYLGAAGAFETVPVEAH